LADYDTIELDDDIFNDLLKNTVEKSKETVDFLDVVTLRASLNREILLGDIGPDVGLTVQEVIRFWNNQDEKNNIPVEKRKPIKIYIHSGGGNLDETFIMIDAIKLSKTPVYTIAVGCAYSGGFFTFIAGHRRFAYPTSSFLFHEGSTSTGGTSSQFANYAAFYKSQLGQLKKLVIENSDLTEEDYKEIQKDDIWMSAEEAQEKGMVDDILAKGFI
jgi:ATP-dependent Clp protease protease subunit